MRNHNEHDMQTAPESAKCVCVNCGMHMPPAGLLEDPVTGIRMDAPCPGGRKRGNAPRS